MKKVSIRFLRQGKIDLEIEEKLLADKKALKTYCEEYVSKVSDEQIINSMADYDNPSINGYFDESVGVAAVEDGDNLELILSTPEWDCFVDVGLNSINEYELNRIMISKDSVDSELYETLKQTPSAIVERKGTADEYIKFITMPASMLKHNKEHYVDI